MDHTDINNPTQETLNLFYKYVSEKNSEGIISMLSDNIDWYIVQSQKLPWTGRLKEKIAIAKALDLLFDAHINGNNHLEMDHNFIDGHEAAVFGTITRKVKHTGKIFTASFCQRFTILDGKITKFLMLEDTPEILKAFKKDHRFRKINN